MFLLLIWGAGFRCAHRMASSISGGSGLINNGYLFQIVCAVELCAPCYQLCGLSILATETVKRHADSLP